MENIEKKFAFCRNICYHIYGLLNIDAIEEVLPHLWSLDKEWIPDDGLNKYGFKEGNFSRNS